MTTPPRPGSPADLFILAAVMIVLAAAAVLGVWLRDRVTRRHRDGGKR